MNTLTEYLTNNSGHKNKEFSDVFVDYMRYVNSYCRRADCKRPTLSAERLRREFESYKRLNFASETADEAASVGTRKAITAVDSRRVVESEEPGELEEVDGLTQAVPSRKDKKRRKSVPVSKDCWHDLYMAFTELHHGADDVSIPDPSPELSPNHRGLFELARDRLVQYQSMNKNEKDCILLKDCQCAMSCLVNLICPSTYNYFEDTFIAKAYDRCMEEDFDKHQQIVSWLKKFKESMDLVGDVRVVRDDASVDKADLVRARQKIGVHTRTMQEKVLEVVELVCDLVTERPFGNVPSENDCLIAWANVFKTMLPDGLTIHTGETSLRSTKAVQGILAEEFGNEGSETGRRVDLKFCHGRIEVANLELKSPSQKRMARAKQTRKNLRLGRCIQLQLENIGVLSPQVLCGDISGYMAIFTKIVKVDDVYVAGKERVTELGAQAQEAAEHHEAQESEAELEDDVEYEVAPMHKAPKTLERTVILTPKKKQRPAAINHAVKPPAPPKFT
ncbi:hypothetical protein BGZ99_010481 [Dissophora globulifera]|uniref:Uncharacterized protein n=1 Tax=Dissophora globulifera TaxID=979702 RepID=A0A9P6UYN1_9FUNG|nr:hypothetical protein BGZ99_010481 [Dissophora globulifera]